MTKTELLQIAKPILFNTDMVRAIQDGRKTVTRRVIRLKYSNTYHEMFTNKYGTRIIEIQDDVEGETFGKNEDGTTWRKLRGYIEPKPPYKKGDYLYVRETWGISNIDYDDKVVYIVYKASENEKDEGCRAVRLPNDKFETLYDSIAENMSDWRPSIHMHKEAARIFLRVTAVRAERLQDMSHDGPLKEGIHFCTCPDGFTWKQETDMKNCYITPMGAMEVLWNSTIPKKDLDKYGWDVNPWVWVIEFERVEAEHEEN